MSQERIANSVHQATVYTHRKAAQSSSKDQVEWLHFDLAWYRIGVEPAELSEIAVDCEVFRVLGLLPPRLSKKEKRARKWVNEWACTPTLNLSIYEIVFSLFAKSEYRIQTIKRIWTETCVFVKMS